MDTSFVSKEAIQCVQRLIESGAFSRVAAQCEVDARFEYPKGTMASYFGKLGAKARKEKLTCLASSKPRYQSRYTQEQINNMWWNKD